MLGVGQHEVDVPAQPYGAGGGFAQHAGADVDGDAARALRVIGEVLARADPDLE